MTPELRLREGEGEVSRSGSQPRFTPVQFHVAAILTENILALD